MPNKKSKNKKGGKARADSGSDDDGSVFNDNESLASMGVSEASTVQEDMDESSAEELLESKFKDAIDLAMEKSAATRIKGLDAMCQGMLKRYVPDFMENRRDTVTDIIEKSLKRGKGAEVQAAAKLALLLGLQLIESEDVYNNLRGTMTQLVSDATQPAGTRAAVASGLSGLCFIAGGDLSEVVNVMKIMESIYSASIPRQDGSIPNMTPETLHLHTVCLSGWGLLSTLLSSAQIHDSIASRVRQLRGLLNSVDVDLRIAAGETLVLLLESVYDHDEDFEPEDFNGLIADLKQLATDSSKAKSKKDRKEQRSTFREVLRGVEEGEPPSESVKFGREMLKLDTWYRKCQYDWFCKIMGPGINFHLGVNSMVREIFELGAPINLLEADSFKLSKTQRNAANQQAFKQRTQLRSKTRDKRSAVF